MTQKLRVLAALRSRGARGITSVDFLLPNIIDGGKPITRVAARVLELRQENHRIVVEGERDGCYIYRLLEDAQDARPVPPAPSAAETLGSLPDAARPRNAIFGWDEEAA
jgi:hypothetical protein